MKGALCTAVVGLLLVPPAAFRAWDDLEIHPQLIAAAMAQLDRDGDVDGFLREEYGSWKSGVFQVTSLFADALALTL